MKKLTINIGTTSMSFGEFSKVVNKQLFGTPSTSDITSDVLRHNSFLMGAKLSTLFVSSLALTYFSKQDAFLNFIDTFGKYPDFIKSTLTYVLFILILSSAVAPLSQGILMWKKNKVTKSIGWLLHIILSLILSGILFLSVFFKYTAYYSYSLLFIWIIGFVLIFVKIFLIGTGERSARNIWNILRISLGWNYFIENLSTDFINLINDTQRKAIQGGIVAIREGFIRYLLWVYEHIFGITIFWISILYLAFGFAFDVSSITNAILRSLKTTNLEQNILTGILIGLIGVYILARWLLRMEKKKSHLYAKIIDKMNPNNT